MARRNFPRKVRKAAIDRADGRCEKCKAALKTGEAEVDHVLPDVLGGEPTLANAQVLCSVCHKEKSADDIRRTRRADRQRDKHSGAIAPKQSIQSAGFRASQHKAKREAAPKPPLPRRPLYQEISQ